MDGRFLAGWKSTAAQSGTCSKEVLRLSMLNGTFPVNGFISINDNPLYQCWCKATNREAGLPRYSANWIGAKRAWFKVYPDHVQCGSWTIPLDKVRSAVLYQARQWFIPVPVLMLTTDSATYQFGFNPWARPYKHLGLELTEERIRLKYSPFSIALRVAVVVYLGYLAWQYFTT